MQRLHVRVPLAVQVIDDHTAPHHALMSHRTAPRSDVTTPHRPTLCCHHTAPHHALPSLRVHTLFAKSPHPLALVSRFLTGRVFTRSTCVPESGDRRQTGEHTGTHVPHTRSALFSFLPAPLPPSLPSFTQTPKRRSPARQFPSELSGQHTLPRQLARLARVVWV